MRKRLFLFLIACLTVAAAAWAAPIDVAQAREIAQRFMTSRGLPATALEVVKKGTNLNAPQAKYHVFNNEQAGSGFIIIAADDRAPAVLGYSDSGSFDPDNLPEALAEMLESYAMQIAELQQGAAPRQGLMARQPVSPMVPSLWAQGNPYNIKLPIVGTKHAVTGCVATAMAQVMYYWKWPACPTMTIPAYTTETMNFNMPALAPVDFNWNQMHDTYLTNDTTSAAADAVATLLLYCAQSVKMDFKESSSGATTTYTPLAFATYFGYEPGAHAIRRSNYTTQEWEDAIYAELQAARPVILSGSKSPGGHAFVCDGCDNTGLFHINWGWNGQSNGYFLLNVLNPDLQGTGSASAPHGYIFDNAAIVGLKPGNTTSSQVMMTVSDHVLNSYTGTRSGTSADFKAVVSARFHNFTSSVMAVDFGWGLFDGDNMIATLYNTYSNSSTPGRYFTLSEKNLSFGAGKTSGTYRIVPICRERGVNAAWGPCAGAEHNYIEVVINGNNCTFKTYGSAATPNYTVNNISMVGNKHPGRPMDIIVNLTNNGESVDDMLYMFIDNTLTTGGHVSLSNGQTGDTRFHYVPTAAGSYTVKFSFNQDGSNPIATRTLVINEMPTANLSATVQLLNVTDPNNRIITSDKYSVVLNIKNNGSQTYREDISITLFKNTHDGYGTGVQSKVQFIELAPGATTSLQFDMDNVYDGWRYFAKMYYYSAGQQIDLASTVFHTIVFPAAPSFTRGDVDDDGFVTISDVTLLINYLLNSDEEGINLQAANCNQDGMISISDVTSLINYLLSDNW